MAIVAAAYAPQQAESAAWKAALTQLLAPLGGAAFFVEPQAKPLIYLGEVWPAQPALGLNPAPALLVTLVKMLKDAGAAEVGLAGRAAPGFRWQQTLDLAGYDIFGANGIPFYDLAAEPKIKRQSALKLACEEMELPQRLLQCSCLINVAKFRTAEGILFGTALQNLAAALDLPAESGHQARALLDLCSIVMPDLQLVDAIRGDQGYQPQREDVLFAATDAVALDLVLTALAGVQAGQVELLTLAAQYGLGIANAADIHLVGDDVRELFQTQD